MDDVTPFLKVIELASEAKLNLLAAKAASQTIRLEFLEAARRTLVDLNKAVEAVGGLGRLPRPLAVEVLFCRKAAVAEIWGEEPCSNT